MSEYTSVEELKRLFDQQVEAFFKNIYPSYEERAERLITLENMLLAYRARIAEAINDDFGNHLKVVSDLLEPGAVIARSMYYRSQLPQWMAPQVREVDPAVHGSSELYVMHQPVGVIGNLAPWNFPVECLLVPVVDMLAAGNRVIAKASESSPATSNLMREAVAEYFSPEVLAVVTGDVELAKAFAAMPWNHLMYTGNSAVARHVMRAASENLTPVTLELGGKNPTIFTEDSIDEKAIGDILAIKMVKSGQVCTSPDYVLLPENKVDQFVTIATKILKNAYPQFVGNPEVTGIINARHYDRLLSYIEDARTGGADVIFTHDEAPNPELRQFPMTLIVNPDENMLVMQEETFGPILPIKTYKTLDEAMNYINTHERPLAAHVYTKDKAVADKVIKGTISGGFCVNGIAMHTVHANAPFGGCGNSGIGCHSGFEGFVNFSHTKTVMESADDNVFANCFHLPYSQALTQLTESFYAAFAEAKAQE